MQRRDFLLAVAASAVVALTGCASSGESSASPTRSRPSSTPTMAAPRPVPTEISPPVPFLVKRPLPEGTITALPDDVGNRLAWTVDDGADSAVVAAYAAFARTTGVRLTFFLNGKYPSWTENAAALRPLVDSGQIQLANHTMNHADLTAVSDAQIAAELVDNQKFITDTFGAQAAPHYFRPPYGRINRRAESVAASAGFTTPVLWYGTLSDSGRITPAQVVEFATKWFLPAHIVIGHANFDPVTQVYPQLIDILRQRSLQTVTLNDVFQV
jgi:peptidoglycan/xylan/chitin deacetylase (PgdA/CDA1 family)